MSARVLKPKQRRSSITFKEATEIRERLEGAPRGTAFRLATEYGVSPQTIYFIRDWKIFKCPDNEIRSKRNCAMCGVEFECYRDEFRKTCSDKECANEYRKLYRRKYLFKTPLTCEHCGKEIKPFIHADGRAHRHARQFCNNKCRHAAKLGRTNEVVAMRRAEFINKLKDAEKNAIEARKAHEKKLAKKLAAKARQNDQDAKVDQ